MSNDMLRNQISKYGSGTDAVLIVSAHRGKHALSVKFHVKASGEKVRHGVPQYFDLNEDVKAQTEFDRLNREALAAGWLLKDKSSKSGGMTSIPQAPGAKKEVKGGQTNQMPQAAKRS